MTAAPEGAPTSAPLEGRGGPQRIPRPPDGAAPGRPAPWADLDDALRRPRLDDVRAALAGAGHDARALKAANQNLDDATQELAVRLVEQAMEESLARRGLV